MDGDQAVHSAASLLVRAAAVAGLGRIRVDQQVRVGAGGKVLAEQQLVEGVAIACGRIWGRGGRDSLSKSNFESHRAGGLTPQSAPEVAVTSTIKVLGRLLKLATEVIVPSQIVAMIRGVIRKA